MGNDHTYETVNLPHITSDIIDLDTIIKHQRERADTDNPADNPGNVLGSLAEIIPQIDAASKMNIKISDKITKNFGEQSAMLDKEISNKTRMTEINNYYSKVNTHINIMMRNLVIILAIIIIFIILSKKGILPSNVSTIVTVICVLTIIIYVVYSVYDINTRDKFNFDEYIIPFDPTAKKLELSGNTSKFTDIRDSIGGELLSGINALENTGICIGEDCCEPGTKYDIDRKACILLCPSGSVYKQTVNPSTGMVEASCQLLAPSG